MPILSFIFFAALIFLLIVGIRRRSARGGRPGYTFCLPQSDTAETLRHIASLPYIDEHTTIIAAETDVVWRGLCETVERSFSRPGMARYARFVGAVYCTATGPRPLAAGSTFPGFRVVSSVPGRKLVLEGCHRFSSYSMIVRLENESPGRSRISAESRAAFPGLAGRLYRLLVIGTGGHVVGMRRLLSAVRRRSEQRLSQTVD